jgi:trimeric autotransporter adhesin
LHLLDDNKTLLITNNGTYTQRKTYKVVVENVEEKGKADSKVAKTEQNVTVIDTTLPSVESVTATSPKTVEIVFSEPIQTGSGEGQFPTTAGVLTDIVQVDGINLYATPDASKMVTENKVTLTLNTPLTAGEHKIKVDNLKDFANLPIEAKEFTVNIPEDTAAPVVEKIEVVHKGKIKVTFNEPIDDATVQANLSNIKVNNEPVVDAIAKEGGKVYEFVLHADHQLGLAALVEATFSYKGIKDNYGNSVTETQTVKFTSTDDTVLPTITNVKVNTDNTVEVTFSEDVTGFTTGNTPVELYDKDNKKVNKAITITPKELEDGTTSEKIYILEIADGDTLSGNYTLKFLKDKVTDLSVRTNKLAETTQAITLNDKVRPEITKVEFVNDSDSSVDFNRDGDYKDSKITIYFDEAMDVATLTNKANYVIDGTPLSDISGASLTAASDAKSVTITVNRSGSASQLLFSADTELRVIAVKDAAGNTLSSDFVNVNLGSGDLGLIVAFEAAPALEDVLDLAKVELIEKNKVKVYATNGYLLKGIDPNKVKFAFESGAPIDTLQVTSVSIAADGKSAVLTLNKKLNADATFIDADGNPNAVKLYALADAVTLTNGAKSNVLDAADSVATLVDKVKASLVVPTTGKLVTDNDLRTVKLTFDEDIFDDPAPGTVAESAIQNALIIRDEEGKRLVPGDDYTVTISGTDVVIAFVDGDTISESIEGYVTVELSNNVTVKGADTNLVNEFTAVKSDTLEIIKSEE